MAKKTLYRNFNPAIAKQIAFLYSELSAPDLDPRKGEAYMYEYLSLTGQWPKNSSAQNIAVIFKATAGLLLVASVAYAIYQVSKPRIVETEFRVEFPKEEE